MSGLFNQSLQILLAVCIAGNCLLTAGEAYTQEPTDSTEMLRAACQQCPLALDIQPLKSRSQALASKGFASGTPECAAHLAPMTDAFALQSDDRRAEISMACTLYSLGCQLIL